LGEAQPRLKLEVKTKSSPAGKAKPFRTSGGEAAIYSERSAPMTEDFTLTCQFEKPESVILRRLRKAGSFQ